MIDYIALARHFPEMLLMLGIAALLVGVPYGIQRLITARDGEHE